MSISTTPAAGPTPHKEVKPPVTSSEVKANEEASPSTNSAEVQGTVEDGADGDKAGRLAGFLQSQKDEFVADLKEGKGKGWIVVMGNEAGDLDSLASSIAYAQLSSALLGLRVVPLSLTPSSLMSLRPENLLAFKNAHLPLSSLLHLDSLPRPAADLAAQGVRFALVDHNKLLPMFGPVSPGLVQGVIDHHDDEGLHEDAEIRLVQVPTGSASSLVVKHFMPQWKASMAGPAGSGGSPVPPELATLLLSAQLIDTHGLKSEPKGKGTPTDMEAAAFLYPLTPWAAGGSVSATDITASSLTASVPPALAEQSALLSEAKFNVSYLSTHDLLLRDYKEYELPTSSSAFPSLRVGLSTVPLGLKAWLERDGDWKSYLAAADAFTVERKLDIEGVLTTFKSAKGKSKREVLLIVRVGGALDEVAAKRVMRELEEGLEKDQELQLEPWDKKGWKRFLSRKKRAGLDGQGRYGRVWQQGNAHATRKKVAPIMRDLVAKLT